VDDLKEELQTASSFITPSTSSQCVLGETTEDLAELSVADLEKVPLLKHGEGNDVKPDINDERCPLLAEESSQHSLLSENMSPNEQELPSQETDHGVQIEEQKSCEEEMQKEAEPIKPKDLPKQLGYSNLIIKAQALKVLEDMEIPKMTKPETLSTNMQMKKPLQSVKAKSLSMEQIAEEYVMKPFNEVQLSSLYSNKELNSCSEFVTEFVETHLRPASKQTHPLQDLLFAYLRAINHLVVNAMDLDAMKKECKEKQSQLWILETTTVSESGECQVSMKFPGSELYRR